MASLSNHYAGTAREGPPGPNTKNTACLARPRPAPDATRDAPPVDKNYPLKGVEKYISDAVDGRLRARVTGGEDRR
jgi:hypothetical protein